MLVLKFITITTLLIAVKIDLLLAQTADPFNSRKDFFDSDFAKSPITKQDQSANEKKSFPENTKAQVNNTEEESSASSPNKSASAAIEKIRANKVNNIHSPLHAGGEWKIDRIGLILNALDQQHVQQVIKELDKLTKLKNMSFSNIYILADPFSSRELFQKMLKYELHGANISIITAIPEKYSHLAKSPTWLLKTTKGEVLVEGLMQLSSRINATGYFTEEMLTPAATPKPTALVAQGGNF